MESMVVKWRQFLKEEVEPPEPQGSTEESFLTPEELQIWQQALKKAGASVGGLKEGSGTQGGFSWTEGEFEDEELPPMEEIDPLDYMRKTQAQAKAEEESEYPISGYDHEIYDPHARPIPEPPEQDIPPIGYASQFEPDPGLSVKLAEPYEKTPYCSYFPEIASWSTANANNFGETVLFVYSTMQTSWPRVATFFRFLVDFVKDSALNDPSQFEKFVYRPPRNEEQTDYNEFKYYLGDKRYRELTRQLRSGLKVAKQGSQAEIRKRIRSIRRLRDKRGRIRWRRNKKLGKIVTRLNLLLKIARNPKAFEALIVNEVEKRRADFIAAGMPSYEEAREKYEEELTKHNKSRFQILSALFRKVHKFTGPLSEDKREYIGRARGVIAYMAATPGAKFYVPTWRNRKEYYDQVIVHANNYKKSQSPEDLALLLEACIGIPGIGQVKGGLLVQLMTGQLGCIDNIWNKVLTASDEQIASKIKQLLRSRTKEETVLDYAKRYIELLNELKRKYTFDSRALFEVWAAITNEQMENEGSHRLNVNVVGADLSYDPFISSEIPYSQNDPETLKYYLRGGGPSQERIAREQDPRSLQYPPLDEQAKRWRRLAGIV
jgi:hypothetical protein